MKTLVVGAGSLLATAAISEKTDLESSCEVRINRAAAEVARQFPPMTGEQAALVCRALRDEKR